MSTFPVRTLRFLFLILLAGATCASQNPPTRQRKPHRAMAVSTSKPSVAVSPGSWSQLAKLVVKGFNDGLGQSVAVSGETVVAAPYHDRSKLAYVFLGSADGWSNLLPVAGLGAPNSVEALLANVAIDGDTIVIGTPSFEGSGPGYAYVYVKPASGWSNMFPTAILTPSGTNDGYFGESVSISGDTIVVGDVALETVGAAYVSVKPPTGWTNMTETAKLTASDGLVTDEFGASVSISGATIAVGAPQTSRSTGKAYVFVQPAGGWTDMTETAKLAASDSQPGSGVGSSLSINDNNILVGAPAMENFSYPPGIAYVFTKPPTGWRDMTQTAELSAADVRADNRFGESVSISGNSAAVGAPGRGTAPNDAGGGIYVFEQPAGGWQTISGSTVVTASDAHHFADFGTSVGMSGKVIVGGSDYFLNAVYVFGLP